MISTHIILAISVIIYGFLHSALAATAVKARIQTGTGASDPLYRLGYNVFAMAGLAGIIILMAAIKSLLLFVPVFATNIFFGILLITGLVGMILCIIKYFRQMSGISSQKQIAKLEISGLHRYVRHPLYLSTFLFLIGIAGCIPLLSVMIFVVLVIGYTFIGIRFEELKLGDKFGNDYLLYQHNTPMLIPYWKKK